MMIFGNVVENDGLKPGIIEFEDGVITNLIREPKSPRNDLFDEYGSFIDRHFLTSDYIIFPGFVDLGAVCYFGKETYQSAALAALSGGITALADISEEPVVEDAAIEIAQIPPNYIVVSNTSDLFENQSPVAITPHHLYFNQDSKSKYLKVDPQLPTVEEQEEVLKHLDVFDYLISGHVPHQIEDKIKGNLVGVPGLDTYGAFITWLIKNKKADITTIFDIACKTPGEAFEAATGRKVGRLIPGHEASFTVLNIAKTAEHGRSIVSKAKWSAFDLRFMPGFVDVVYYKGEKVVDGPWLRNFARIS